MLIKAFSKSKINKVGKYTIAVGLLFPNLVTKQHYIYIMGLVHTFPPVP